jgi:YebC/PmpR family DNA-binding regulatory protein
VAGHSKWANIKHRKAAVDKKRGRLWSKCSRAIMAAARAGGGDPATNLALRYAIDEARYANMPKDTIQRAIDKGAGASGGDNWEQIRYEGYGPGGVAILIDALTDNRTRTAADVRSIFTKWGGNLGQTGSVGFMFETKGRILVEATRADEDTIMAAAIEAGADDVQAPGSADDFWSILTDPASFQSVKESIEGRGIEIAQAEVAMVPLNTMELRGEDARRLLGLVEALEDNDDVQKVYTNADIPEEELAAEA